MSTPTIRAKFRCTHVTKHDGGNEQVRLMAVNGPTEENKQWSKYTPSGSLEMSITQDGAQGAFTPGKEYFLDFTPVE